jgi:Ca2+-binding EF-hand superfamily protein
MSANSKIALAIASSLSVAAMGGAAFAADTDQNLAAGEPQTKELLRLMDRDKNGKVSKAEFMSFMATEFTRLDKNHDGALDPNELSQASIRGFSGDSTVGTKKTGGSGSR